MKLSLLISMILTSLAGSYLYLWYNKPVDAMGTIEYHCCENIEDIDIISDVQ
jgi:hypothetical protein